MFLILHKLFPSQTKVSVPYINNMLQYVSDKPARYNSPMYYGYGNTRMQLATMRLGGDTKQCPSRQVERQSANGTNPSYTITSSATY